MKQTRHQDFQRQITNLIPIIEMYIPLIEEVEKSKNKLNMLPTQLENLKQKLEFLKLESSPTISDNLPSKIQETEFEIDFLVDDLEGILVHLTSFDRQVKNLIAIRERLEAVQKERIDGFTPERIYKILERRQQLSSYFPDNMPSTQTNRFENWWQKIVNYKFFRKLVITTVSISGIILLFSTISYSAINQQLDESETVTKIRKPIDSSTP